MASFAATQQRTHSGPSVSLQSAFVMPAQKGFKAVDNPDRGAQATAGVAKIAEAAQVMPELQAARAEMVAQQAAENPQASHDTSSASMVMNEARNGLFFGAIDMATGGNIGAGMQAASLAMTAGAGLMRSVMGLGSHTVLQTGRDDSAQYAQDSKKGKDEPSSFEHMASAGAETLMTLSAPAALDPFARFRAQQAPAAEQIGAHEALLVRGTEEAGLTPEQRDAVVIASMGDFASNTDPVDKRELRPDLAFQKSLHPQPSALAPAAFNM